MLFTGESGSEKAIAYAKSCSYDYSVDTEKVVDKDAKQGGSEERIGSTITISSENNVQADMADYLALVKKAQSGGKVGYFIGIVDNPDKNGKEAKEWEGATTGLKGSAIIKSINLSAPAEGMATFSLSLSGVDEPTPV